MPLAFSSKRRAGRCRRCPRRRDAALVARACRRTRRDRVDRLLALGVTPGASVTVLQTFPGHRVFLRSDRAGHRTRGRRLDSRPFAEEMIMTSPLRLVFWETTKACNLSCQHCRAVPQRTLGPTELTTRAGVRPDRRDRARSRSRCWCCRAASRCSGPTCSTSASTASRAASGWRWPPTARWSTERVAAKIADAGFSRVAISLDGAVADDPRSLPRHAGLARACAARHAQPARGGRVGPDQLDHREAQRRRAAGAARPRAGDRRRRAAPVHAGAGRLRPRDRAGADAAGRRIRAGAALVRRAVEDLPDRPEGDLRAALLPHPRAAARRGAPAAAT